MSNIINLHNHHHAVDEWLRMSNGLTEVFIEVMALAGSSLARTTREKELIIWLSEHDQNVVGSGTVGFSISEMPWTHDDFANEKEFLLTVAEAARHKKQWEFLNYSPHKMIFDCLDKFSGLIEAFEATDIDNAVYQDWKNSPLETQASGGFPKCEMHKILLHWHGCVICNDMANPLDDAS